MSAQLDWIKILKSRQTERFTEMRERMREREMQPRLFRDRTATDMIVAVSQATGVPAHWITMAGKSLAEVTEARYYVARALRYLGWSFPKISLALNANPTSIMYLLKKYRPPKPDRFPLPSEEPARKPPTVEEFDHSKPVPFPDLSGEWAI
jgi:hypothetical protein